ncbi:MAG TPA: tRNA 2-thiouridine(34) synthase MnmA [Acidimicrobiales bacterium]
MGGDGPVLVAMSGGVDSSVAAALLLDAGVDVIGVTLRLWGGTSDSGCCSVADVDDARRVAQQLGIDHYVFAMSEAFESHVVAPYVADHLAGRTPNPCIECNRHLKFGALLDQSVRLGASAVATGHHAQVDTGSDGRLRLRRGADPDKDQSYVVSVMGQDELARVRFPVGAITKHEVRRLADQRGLRTASKPESQDVCFIRSDEGRHRFMSARADLHAGRVIDGAGHEVGRTEAVELVTIGQRKGLHLAGGGARRYVTRVDIASRTVTVGSAADTLGSAQPVEAWTWTDGAVPDGTEVDVQTSAHSRPCRAVVAERATRLEWIEPRTAVAPGQAVVIYDGDVVLGGAVAAA